MEAAAGATAGSLYWQQLMQHVAECKPLDALPEVPDDHTLDLMLRAAAVVMRKPVHFARLQAPVPELCIYAPTSGAQPVAGFGVAKCVVFKQS
jgi:hypothetical protein